MEMDEISSSLEVNISDSEISERPRLREGDLDRFFRRQNRLDFKLLGTWLLLIWSAKTEASGAHK